MTGRSWQGAVMLAIPTTTSTTNVSGSTNFC